MKILSSLGYVSTGCSTFEGLATEAVHPEALLPTVLAAPVPRLLPLVIGSLDIVTTSGVLNSLTRSTELKPTQVKQATSRF